MKYKKLVGFALILSILAGLLLPHLSAVGANGDSQLLYAFDKLYAETQPGRHTKAQELDFEVKTEGAASVKFSENGSGASDMTYWVYTPQAPGSQVNITLYDYITFDIWLETRDRINGFEFRCGTDVIDQLKYVVAVDKFNRTGWTSITVPVADLETVSGNHGNLNRESIKMFRFQIITSDNNPFTVRLDNFWATDVAAACKVWDFDAAGTNNFPRDYTENEFDSNDKIQGLASEKIVGDSTKDNRYMLQGIGSHDLSRYNYWTYYLWVEDASKIDKLTFRFGTNNVDGWEYILTTPLKNGWNYIVLPIADFNVAVSGHNIKDIKNARIWIYAKAAESITYKLDYLCLTNNLITDRYYGDKMLRDFDITSNFTVDTPNNGIFTDDEDKTQGKGSASIAASSVNNNLYLYYTSDPLDLTLHKYISFNMWLEDASRLQKLTYRFGTNSVDDMEYVVRQALTDGWNHIIIPIDDFSIELGNHDIKNIKMMRVRFTLDSADEFIYKMDNLILTNAPVKNQTPEEIFGFNSIVNQNFPKGSGAEINQGIDNEEYTEGNASTAVYYAGGGLLQYWLQGTQKSFNVNEYAYITFGLWLEDASRVSSLKFRYGKSAVDGAEMVYQGELKNGWNHIVLPLSDFKVTDVPQFYLPTEVNQMRLEMNVSAGRDLLFRFDNMWLTAKENQKPNIGPGDPPAPKELESDLIFSFDKIRTRIFPVGDDDYPFTQTVDSGDCTQGTGSIKVNIDKQTNRLNYWIQNISTYDMTKYKYVEFDVKLENVVNIKELHFRFGMNSVDGFEYKWAKPLKNGWNSIKMPIADFIEQVPAQAVMAEIKNMRITLIFKTPTENVTFGFDNLRLTKIKETIQPEELNSFLLWGFEKVKTGNRPIIKDNGLPLQQIDTSEKTQGAGSSSFTVSSLTGSVNYWLEDIGTVDLTDYIYLDLDIWIEDPSEIKRLFVRAGNPAVDGAEYVMKTPLVAGWNKIRVPVDEFQMVLEQNYNMDCISKIRYTFEFFDEVKGFTMKFDNLSLAYDTLPSQPTEDHGDKEHLSTSIWDFDLLDSGNFPVGFTDKEEYVSQALDYTVKTQGESSAVLVTDGDYERLNFWFTRFGIMDVTSCDSIEFDLWVDDPDLISFITVRFGSTTVDGSETTYRKPVVSGWNHIILPLSGFKEVLTQYNVLTAINYMRISLHFGTSSVGKTLRFDNLVARYWGYPDPVEQETEAYIESDSQDINIMGSSIYLRRIMTVEEFLNRVSVSDGFTCKLVYNNKLLTNLDTEIPDKSVLEVYKANTLIKTYTVFYYASANYQYSELGTTGITEEEHEPNVNTGNRFPVSTLCICALSLIFTVFLGNKRKKLFQL